MITSEAIIESYAEWEGNVLNSGNRSGKLLGPGPTLTSRYYGRGKGVHLLGKGKEVDEIIHRKASRGGCEWLWQRDQCEFGTDQTS